MRTYRSFHLSLPTSFPPELSFFLFSNDISIQNCRLGSDCGWLMSMLWCPEKDALPRQRVGSALAWEVFSSEAASITVSLVCLGSHASPILSARGAHLPRDITNSNTQYFTLTLNRHPMASTLASRQNQWMSFSKNINFRVHSESSKRCFIAPKEQLKM